MSTDGDLEETEADRAYEPTPGCCEDCDDALDEIAAFRAELLNAGEVR